MARPKRTSQVLETAHQRLAGLNSINPPPDFGSVLTLTGYATHINAFSAKLDTYNQMIAALDDFQNQVNADEAGLREISKRMLIAAEAYYGSDSSQYEQAGGTRLSDRKRRTKKTPDKPEN